MRTNIDIEDTQQMLQFNGLSYYVFIHTCLTDSRIKQQLTEFHETWLVDRAQQMRESMPCSLVNKVQRAKDLRTLHVASVGFLVVECNQIQYQMTILYLALTLSQRTHTHRCSPQPERFVNYTKCLLRILRRHQIRRIQTPLCSSSGLLSNCVFLAKLEFQHYTQKPPELVYSIC